MEKIPNYKSQFPNKLQYSNPSNYSDFIRIEDNIFFNSIASSNGVLNFGHWNLFGIWPACAKRSGEGRCLGFGAYVDVFFDGLQSPSQMGFFVGFDGVKRIQFVL